MNRLLPLLACVWALCACGTRDDPPPARDVQVGSERGRLSLTGFELVKGTPYALLLLSEETGKGSYGSGELSERNRLVLDTTSGVSGYLLPDNSRNFVTFHVGQTRAAQDIAAQDIKGVTYSGRNEGFMRLEPGTYVAVVTATTGKTKGRRFDLLAGKLGGEQRTLARGLQHVDQLWSLQPTLLAAVVEMDGNSLYRVYDLNSAALVREAALPF